MHITQTDCIHNYGVRSCIKVHDRLGILEETENGDARTFLNSIKPIAFEFTSNRIDPLDPNLNCAFPNNHDLVVLHGFKEDCLSLFINLLPNQIYNSLNCRGLQPTQIGDVMHKLILVNHIFVIVMVHIFVYVRIQWRELTLDML